MTSGLRLRRTWRNVEGRVQCLLLRDGPDRDVPVFEPLAPVAPEDDDPLLEPYLGTVLDGSRRDQWIDVRSMTSRPRGRVVKMVRSCLMLGWLAARFPGIPIVFVTRDPLAVVRSRIRMQWDPRPDLAALVEQPELRGATSGSDAALRARPEQEFQRALCSDTAER